MFKNDEKHENDGTNYAQQSKTMKYMKHHDKRWKTMKTMREDDEDDKTLCTAMKNSNVMYPNMWKYDEQYER